MESVLPVGVKYCGGCNAGYDRVAALDDIRRRCPDIPFEYAKKDTRYSFLLVLCGCRSACADVSELQSVYGALTVCSRMDAEAAAAMLLSHKTV